ncbi:MAG: hypothetical protein AAGD01_17940 [Acidobacteriota bacterium]
MSLPLAGLLLLPLVVHRTVPLAAAGASAGSTVELHGKAAHWDSAVGLRSDKMPTMSSPSQPAAAASSSSATEPVSQAPISWPRRLGIAVLIAMALAGGWRGWRGLVNESSLGAARWIGPVAQNPRLAEPSAFLAVADFEVVAHPQNASLSVSVDGQYRALLNGRAVGGGRMVNGDDSLHRYEVAPLLVQGGNRLVVEVSNGLGHSMVAARLSLEGEAAVTTGSGDFRLLRQSFPGLVSGWRGAGEGDAMNRWGQPPQGRSGELVENLRPVLDGEGATRVVSAQVEALGPRDWLVSFAEPTVGTLAVLLGEEGSDSGLLFVEREEGSADSPSIPALSRQGAVAELLLIPGQRRWWDHSPRQWHQVRILGPSVVEGAELWQHGADDEVLAPQRSVVELPGAFGLSSPRLSHPLADIVWGALQEDSAAEPEPQSAPS